jgi:hypothetical protein
MKVTLYSFHPNTTHQASIFGTRENAWLIRLPFYKFRYYAMANLDVDMEPSYKTKHIANLTI